MKCPHCNQEDLIWINHGKGWKTRGYGKKTHHYCRNCDYGLCSGEC